MAEELDDRIDRLVDRILVGQCLPFLGAGISMGAKVREGAAEGGADDPTLKACDLTQRLAAALKHHWLAAGPPPPHLLEMASQGAKDGSLGTLAELCWSTLGPTETVRLLQFQKWNRYCPTAAHHYLAVLVREGFVTEVLETNYDHLVERAVWETLAVRDTALEVDLPCSYKEAGVVHDLNSYRSCIAAVPDYETSQNLVRVVKLNGCAVAWTQALRRYEHAIVDNPAPEAQACAQGDLKRASRQIGLTEEQLQGWDGKRWARDLLQVRTRGRSLFFVGFAGADPLVRHHMLAVLREFRESGPGKESEPVALEWWKQPNAPFLMEYKARLAFPQFQILRAFRDAHSDSEKLDDVYNNAFIGGDGPGVRERLPKAAGAASKLNEELPADELLALLASRAVERHVQDRVLRRDGPLDAYLRGALRHPTTLLALVRDALATEREGGASRWAAWMALEQPSTANQRASTWSQACFALKGDDAGRAGYRPFKISNVRQPMLLVALWLGGRAFAPERKVALPTAQELRAAIAIGVPRSGADAPPPGGIVVNLQAWRRDDAGSQVKRQIRFPIVATGHVDRALRTWADHAHSAGLPQTAVLLALGRGSTVFRRQVRARVQADGEGKDGSITIRNLHVVGDLAALRGPEGDAGRTVPEAIENLRRLARDPAAWRSDDRDWRRFCTEIT